MAPEDIAASQNKPGDIYVNMGVKREAGVGNAMLIDSDDNLLVVMPENTIPWWATTTIARTITMTIW